VTPAPAPPAPQELVVTIRIVDGNGLELVWPAGDDWALLRGTQQIAMHTGTATAAPAPGRYRIQPVNTAVFEPIEFEVEAGRKTVITPASGTFEFEWAGQDFWKLMRGQTIVATVQGAGSRVVAPGHYRIETSGGEVFTPVEFDVAPGQTAKVGRSSGTFEFEWAGKDFWTLRRGPTVIATHQGADGRIVEPGRYRIEPSGDDVFEPIEFDVEAEKATKVERPSGRFDFEWAGKDFWALKRGRTHVATHAGSFERIVAPGHYRIEPSGDEVFEPIEFDVEAGKTTRIGRVSGVASIEYAQNTHWQLRRGRTHVATHAGSMDRVLAPGAYRIEPTGASKFKPVEFTVEAGKTTAVALK
jgi:hypothetical protein